MVHYRYPSGHRVRPKKRHNLFLTATLVAISMSPVAYYAKLQGPDAPPPVALSAPPVAPPMALSAPAAPPARVPNAFVMTKDPATAAGTGWSPVDPSPALKPESLALAHNAPLTTAFRPLGQPRAVAAAPAPVVAAPVAAPEQTADAPSAVPEPLVAQALMPVPLPVPRPAELRIARAAEPAKPEAPRAARAPLAAPVQVAAAPVPPDSNPNFIEKLFGIKPSRPPADALSYAALETGNVAPSSRLNSVAGDGTAVYDISAKMVIMPNGERLEAHSGLGDKLDDPRFVHVRMKGATPPGTYTLTEREALFHGVRAIRLTPVGGSGAIYGRDGILAHTYMLGPNGDSNGCVSFRDYNRFLQAFLRGEVKRMVVVLGRGQDALPRIVGRGRTG